MSVRGYRMKVSTVDRQGKRKGPVEWVDVPPATRHANGFANIEPFVCRVLSSKAVSSWVTIATVSGRSALSVSKHNGECRLGLTVEVKQRAKEAKVRAFFSKRGIAPARDYLARNGGVPNATRVLDYPMSGDAKAISMLVVAALRDLYRLSERSALDMRITEYEAS